MMTVAVWLVIASAKSELPPCQSSDGDWPQEQKSGRDFSAAFLFLAPNKIGYFTRG